MARLRTWQVRTEEGSQWVMGDRASIEGDRVLAFWAGDTLIKALTVWTSVTEVPVMPEDVASTTPAAGDQGSYPTGTFKSCGCSGFAARAETPGVLRLVVCECGHEKGLHRESGCLALISEWTPKRPPPPKG